MYYALDEKEMEMVEKVSKITGTDFELINHLIPVENLVSALAEMLYEYNNKCEELEDIEENLRTNYKPIPIDYGMSDRDFI